MDITNDNQVEEMNIDVEYLLPEGMIENEEGDIVDESTEESTETTEESEEDSEVIEEETEESEEETEETPEVNFEDMEVKFLHERKKVRDIPYEDRIKYMQLGMNQGRLQEKFVIANALSSELKEVSDIFKFDEPKALLDALMEQHYKTVAETEQRNINDVRKDYTSGKKSPRDKMYERFLDKNPDIVIEDIPQEVINSDDIQKAYDDYKRDNMIQEKDDKIKELTDKVESLTKGD